MEIIRGARQMLVNPRNKLLLIRIIFIPLPAPRLERALRLPQSLERNNTDYFLDPFPAKLPGRIFEPPSFGAAASATFRRRRRA